MVCGALIAVLLMNLYAGISMFKKDYESFMKEHIPERVEKNIDLKGLLAMEEIKKIDNMDSLSFDEIEDLAMKIGHLEKKIRKE